LTPWSLRPFAIWAEWAYLTGSMIRLNQIGRLGLPTLLMLSGLPAAAGSFYDDFDDATLAPRWVVETSGAGTMHLDGAVECESPGIADVCAVRLSDRIDKASSQLFVFAVSDRDDNDPQWWVTLVDAASPPPPGTLADWNTKVRARIGVANVGAAKGIKFEYHDAQGDSLWWDGTGESWDTTLKLANSPIRPDDYSLVGIEIDAAGDRWRMMAWGRRSWGGYTFDQGLRLFSMTDWVGWSSMESTDDLWLVLGDPLTDALAGRISVDSARLDAGPRHDLWINSKPPSGRYLIRHGWGYESAAGGVEFAVQQDRDGITLDIGAPGAWDDHPFGVKDPVVIVDDVGTYWMVYQSGNDSIGLASSPSVNGPWSKFAGNPLASSDPPNNLFYLFAPGLLHDRIEVDPDKRYKLFYTGVDDPPTAWQIYLMTAPAMSGPWTDRGVILGVGPAGQFDANGYARPRPVYYGGQWVVLLSAKNKAETGNPWRITHAVGPSLESLTRSGQILVDRGLGPASDVTTDVAGRTVSVVDSTGFVPHGFVEIDQDSAPSNYGQSRIRRVVDATTVELLHGLDGFTVATPAKLVQVDGANRFEIADVVKVGQRWWIYVTAFQFFGEFSPALNAFDENSGLLSSDNLTGPYEWNFRSTPVITRGAWHNQASNENISFVHPPVWDVDADGYGSNVECNDADGSAWELPGATAPLLFGADRATIAWGAPAAPGGTAVSYDLLRSTDPADFSAAAAACVETATVETHATDAQTPPAGVCFSYLLRTTNGCGSAPLGAAAAPRSARNCP